MSACADAASVVTVLLTIGDHDCLRRGAARLILNARENIVCFAIACDDLRQSCFDSLKMVEVQAPLASHQVLNHVI